MMANNFNCRQMILIVVLVGTLVVLMGKSVVLLK